MTQLDVRVTPSARESGGIQSLQREKSVGDMRWWALVAVIAAVWATAVWLSSPRFAIDTPSLVDDWIAIEHTGEQLSDLVRFSSPEEQRFRPGWILWSYLQWHTFDAPGLIGPNAWNLLRILVLVAGLSLLTALALPAPRSRWEAILQAGLAAIPSLLVVSAPKFAVDLARFGPQEPLLVGGMALGGSLLVLAARALLDDGVHQHWWRVAVPATAGVLLWTLGVYHKEVSLAAIPLIAAVVFAGKERLARWRYLRRGRRVTLVFLGAVAALPFFHVALESARIASRGDLVYDAQVDGGLGAWDGVRLLYDWTHEVLPPNWRLCAIGAVALTVVAIAFRRKVDVIALGALASGGLAFAMAGQAGVVATRYYIPAFALFMVALALSLSRFPLPVQVVGLVALAVAFVPPEGAREEVDRWTAEEQQDAALVTVVADAYQAGCVVAVSGLDQERSDALPVVVGLELGPTRGQCADGRTYLVVGRGDSESTLLRVCADIPREPVLEGALARVYRCAKLAERPVRDPELGLKTPGALVRLRALRM